MLSSKKASTQDFCASVRLPSSTSLIPFSASSPKTLSTVRVNSSSYSAYSLEMCLRVFSSAMRLSVATLTRKNSSRLLE